VQLFRKQGLDAVVTRSTTFLPFLVRLKKRLGVPAFYESHDFFADLSLRTDLTGKNRFRQSRLERACVPRLSGVFCLQESQIEWYQKVFAGQTFYLLRTGIHEVYRHPIAERKYVAYIGSLDFHKGVGVLLRALSRSALKPHLLLIGGKTKEEMETVKKEVSRHYQPDKVTVTGWVNKEQLHGYLKQTALGIIPLRDTFFNRYLTSPLKLFDYYSFGIPVIASDLPTTRSLITENETGFFFTNEDPAELANRIDRLFGDRKLLEKMSESVYKRAESYRWSKRAERISAIVNEHIPIDPPFFPP
jgi:glycosyltransferase involved in cell wall biosynthesis